MDKVVLDSTNSKVQALLQTGDTLTAVDIIGHAIILEVVVPSTGQVVSLGTRYPVAKKAEKYVCKYKETGQSVQMSATCLPHCCCCQ